MTRKTISEYGNSDIHSGLDSALPYHGECGVSSLQAQIRANTMEGIEKYYKGKLHIGLDLDRQMFAFCSPNDIREHVKEGVERLGSPEGGLKYGS